MFAESLGKQVVQAEDEPGFVVNRILLPMNNEAVFVLGQGTANVTDDWASTIRWARLNWRIS